jgi:hypothetical protein
MPVHGDDNANWANEGNSDALTLITHSVLLLHMVHKYLCHCYNDSSHYYQDQDNLITPFSISAEDFKEVLHLFVSLFYS